MLLYPPTFTPSIVGRIFSILTIRCLSTTITLFPIWTNIYCPLYSFKMLKTSINKAWCNVFHKSTNLALLAQALFYIPILTHIIILSNSMGIISIIGEFCDDSFFLHTSVAHVFSLFLFILLGTIIYQQNSFHSLWHLQ